MDGQGHKEIAARQLPPPGCDETAIVYVKAASRSLIGSHHHHPVLRLLPMACCKKVAARQWLPPSNVKTTVNGQGCEEVAPR